MKKIILIGFKDVLLVFRDPAALVMMLLAPFLLTVGMGFVTGRFSGSTSSGLSEIPVVIVNLDGGELGNSLVSVFQSAELDELLVPTVLSDTLSARQLVDEDKAAAAVIVPAGFTASIIPAAGQDPGSEVMKINLYLNPGRPTSAAVVQSIVDEFVGRVELGRVGGEVAILQLMKNGLIGQDSAALRAAGELAGKDLASGENSQPLITLNKTSQGKGTVDFDILAYMAPGMALMFLMYTVSYGGRSILVERSLGTLPRLLVSPTSTTQVLGGKVLGIYLTGLAQIAILIAASTTLFQVRWGDPLGTIVLVLAAVFGATGWGMLLTAVSRTSGQAANVGTTVMLIFGILGGSFIDTSNLPVWLQWVSKITPNAWGLDGFSTLATGGSLADLGAPVLALLVMGAALFGAAVLLFNRSSIVER